MALTCYRTVIPTEGTTTVDMVDRAQHDLARVRVQITRLQDQLRSAEAERLRLESFLELAARYQEERAEDEASRRDSKASRIRELARAAIAANGGPLAIHAIVAAVEQGGEEVTGKDKNSYVSAILSRDPSFMFQKDQGWAVQRPIPRRDLLASLERLQAQGAPLDAAQENDA
jgi:hypothetical protein